MKIHFSKRKTFTMKDSYCVKKTMNSDTAIRVLMRELTKKESWFAITCLFTKNHVKRLFFVKIFFQNITKMNSKIYFIDCIYKTNQYRLFLCIIIDVTFLNIIFYVAFCFLSKKNTNNYEWMLQQLREVCEKINVSDFNVIVIDNEKNLITAISKIFFLFVNFYVCDIWIRMFFQIAKSNLTKMKNERSFSLFDRRLFMRILKLLQIKTEMSYVSNMSMIFYQWIISKICFDLIEIFFQILHESCSTFR